MVSTVIGSGAGLVNTSKELIGPGCELGNAATGRAGERLTVNAATGNRLNSYLSAHVPQVPLMLKPSNREQQLGMFGGDIVWGAVAPGAVVKAVGYATETATAVRTMVGTSESLAAQAVERAALLRNPLGSAELAIGTASRPTVQWALNAGGVVRTPDEMMALAKQAGVAFPEDVRVFWVKPSQLLNTEGALAEYSVLQANLGGGRVGNAANLRPNDLVTWESFQTRTGTVPVRVSADLLRSDEAAIAHLAHESYELNGLYNSLEVQGNLMRYADLNRLVRPVASETGVPLGGVANNLHENAWTYADQVILKWRGR